MGVLMETEVWPNVQRGHQRRNGVPMVLANGRLSERACAKACAWLW